MKVFNLLVFKCLTHVVKRACLVGILLLSVTFIKAQLLPHTDPNNSGNWVLQSDFSDEFDGNAINSSKWHIQGTSSNYYNGWKGRAPSQFVPANVAQSNGVLTITSKWEPNFNFANASDGGYKYGSKPITTGALISKKFIKHCYMEIRCKVGESPMSGSFWGVDNSNNGELDVFEHVGEAWDTEGQDNADINTKMHSSFHSWKPARPGNAQNRVWTNNHKMNSTVNTYHVYAADWTDDFFRLYCDGKLIKEITKAHAQSIVFGSIDAWPISAPMRLWVDSEIFSWHGSLDKLTADMFENSFFEVDYVRVWTRGAGGSTAKLGFGPNLVTNGTFANNVEGWLLDGTYSRPDVSGWGFWKDDNTSADNYCLQIGQNPSTAKQVITVEPNTTYLLSAQMRMPGTTGTLEPKGMAGTDYSFWNEGWFGVENYGGSKKEVKLFYNWFQSYSIEFHTGNTTKATIYFTNKAVGSPFHIDEVSVVKLNDLTSSTVTPPAGNISVTGVSLSSSNKTLAIGQSTLLTAQVAPSNATNKRVTWQSSDATVATVNASGMVSALKAGTCTITAKSVDGGKQATCNITVSSSNTNPGTTPVSINDGTFESGNLKAWSKSYGTVANVKINAHSGSRACKVSNGAVQQELKGLQPNTTYVLSAWGKVVKSSASLGVKNYGGNEVSVSYSKKSYIQKSVTFTTGANSTSALIYFWVKSSASAYIDDVTLSVKNTTKGSTKLYNETPDLFSALNVYPNPSNGTITIDGLNNATSVSLYNLQGKVVLNKLMSGSNNSLQTNDLRGIYFLKLESESVSHIERVIIK